MRLNINTGMNRKLKESCQSLSEFTQYVERVKGYLEEMPLEDAVEQAVTECIKENILHGFLMKNKAEVTKMSIFEYDEELHRKSMLEEGRKEGTRKTAIRLLKMGKLSFEEFADGTGLPLEEVKALEEENFHLV